MKPQLRDFDVSKYIDTPEAEFELLADAIDTGDASYFAHALGIIARARGMTEIAVKSGITREALYRALSSEGDPKLKTLFSVTKAMGYKLRLEQAN